MHTSSGADDGIDWTRIKALPAADAVDFANGRDPCRFTDQRGGVSVPLQQSRELLAGCFATRRAQRHGLAVINQGLRVGAATGIATTPALGLG
jgi:hypothetical protein